MTEKSRLLDLLARRESVQLSKSRLAISDLAKRHADAATRAARLEGLLDSRRIAATVVCKVQDLRIAHRMNVDMAVQMQLGAAAAAQLLAELSEARAAMARQDHKTRHLEETAKTTRRAEGLAREAMAENSIPANRRK